MKSGKQRRLEIKEQRRKKIKALKKIDTTSSIENMQPLYSVVADHSQLDHINTYSPLPNFYVDQPFTCQLCNASEIWTAKQQKWWYEIAKGHIDSTAVHCRKCRDKIKREKDLQQQHMQEMAQKKPHPNEAFFKKH